MEDFCDYIIANVGSMLDEKITMQRFSYSEFYDMDDCIGCISECLDIEKTAIVVNNDNLFTHRKPVISFKFKSRSCEIYEHYGSQRDYLCVRLMPVS